MVTRKFQMKGEITYIAVPSGESIGGGRFRGGGGPHLLHSALATGTGWLQWNSIGLWFISGENVKI